MSRSTVAYSPPLCVWKVVKESTSPEKLPIIRSLIGESKVEYASDLRCELDSLVEIWYELNSGTVLAVHYSKRKSGLPEPPQQREMLIREIQLLLENLKDKENGPGLIPSDCDETVINYTNHILEQQTPPSTTPMLRSASRNSSTPILLNNEEIGDVVKNIPVLDNETPIDVLRNAIQHECEVLLEDIEYVRRCVEEGRCDFEEIVEPSLTELRQERKKLENHLIKSIELTPSPSRENTKLGRLSSPTKSKRNNTPVTKRRSLPPVRPSSAMQYTKSRGGVPQPTPKNFPVKIEPEGSNSPVLGIRSHTFPSEIGTKSPKKVKRRNSAYAILGRKHPKRDSSDSAGISAVDSGLNSPPDRRMFCGTPDSGVSSRAPSELGMVESTPVFDSLEHLKSLSKHLSDLQVSRSPAVQANHSDIANAEWYKIAPSEAGTNAMPEIARQYSLSKESTHIPKPPPQRRPRAMQSARVHKIKASGLHGT